MSDAQASHATGVGVAVACWGIARTHTHTHTSHTAGVMASAQLWPAAAVHTHKLSHSTAQQQHVGKSPSVMPVNFDPLHAHFASPFPSQQRSLQSLFHFHLIPGLGQGSLVLLIPLLRHSLSFHHLHALVSHQKRYGRWPQLKDFRTGQSRTGFWSANIFTPLSFSACLWSVCCLLNTPLLHMTTYTQSLQPLDSHLLGQFLNDGGKRKRIWPFGDSWHLLCYDDANIFSVWMQAG